MTNRLPNYQGSTEPTGLTEQERPNPKEALLEELKEMHQFLGELIAELEENPQANIPLTWVIEQLRPVLGK